VVLTSMTLNDSETPKYARIHWDGELTAVSRHTLGYGVWAGEKKRRNGKSAKNTAALRPSLCACKSQMVSVSVSMSRCTIATGTYDNVIGFALYILPVELRLQAYNPLTCCTDPYVIVFITFTRSTDQRHYEHELGHEFTLPFCRSTTFN